MYRETQKIQNCGKFEKVFKKIGRIKNKCKMKYNYLFSKNKN